MNQAEKFADIIKNSNYIVFFGGAGTSTDSGIKDFRGKDGLYKSSFKGYSPEEILSIDFFNSNTDDFNEYVDEKLSIKNIKPNKGHFALFELEKMGKLKRIITQNIDNLHQDAGNKNVLELHGTLKKWFCLSCDSKLDSRFVCECGGVVRPEVTLYGEALNNDIVEAAIREIRNSDTLIIAGTSLTVYPAAYYIQYFQGKNLIIINESETPYDSSASLLINDNFSEIMDDLIKKLKE